MSDQHQLRELLGEFTRVGVDPDTFTAMLAVRPEEALQVLRHLPDGAGPGAFLARLRQLAPRQDSPAAGAVRRGLEPPRDEPRP